MKLSRDELGCADPQPAGDLAGHAHIRACQAEVARFVQNRREIAALQALLAACGVGGRTDRNVDAAGQRQNAGDRSGEKETCHFRVPDISYMTNLIETR